LFRSRSKDALLPHSLGKPSRPWRLGRSAVGNGSVPGLGDFVLHRPRRQRPSLHVAGFHQAGDRESNRGGLAQGAVESRGRKLRSKFVRAIVDLWCAESIAQPERANNRSENQPFSRRFSPARPSERKLSELSAHKQDSSACFRVIRCSPMSCWTIENTRCSEDPYKDHQSRPKSAF